MLPTKRSSDSYRKVGQHEQRTLEAAPRHRYRCCVCDRAIPERASPHTRASRAHRSADARRRLRRRQAARGMIALLLLLAQADTVNRSWTLGSRVHANATVYARVGPGAADSILGTH